MSFFIGIAGPWLLVAVFLMMMHRRAEDETAGQWRAEPSRFFGGPGEADRSASGPTQPSLQAKPAVPAGTVH